MTHADRLAAFVALGQRLTDLTTPSHADELANLAARARNQNNWFDLPNVTSAIRGIAHLLDEEPLRQWSGRYRPEPTTPAKLG
ncbi:hypothetical protein [Hymenobacter sp. 5516J-16]|uniref:hypothetical protein n=1 Tax=Hymenobacter sp. 5516J-16 TaxID=2932253 RepID=UPI00293F0282|nr:hypothetical protein [Hymenobacter sp. 5516J-16]